MSQTKPKNVGNQHARKELDKVSGSRLIIRCTKLELDLWTSKAKKAGLTKSAYTRKKLNEN